MSCRRMTALFLLCSAVTVLAARSAAQSVTPSATRQTPTSTDAAIALGRTLFFDPQLSKDGTIACATCHVPSKGFADGRRVAVGIGGAVGTRNTPSIVNTASNKSWFWDGRAATLEEQVLGPIENPVEMGLPLDELERRLSRPRGEIATALAAYLRTIVTTGSRYERDRPAARTMTEEELAGFQVFVGRGRCTQCHGGTHLSDNRFHNTGVAWRDGRLVDEGRFAVTQDPRDHGAFKSPALKDVALTAPYMHDGSLDTLEEVVTFYREGGRVNPYLDSSMLPIDMSDYEARVLVAFLKALTGTTTEGLAPPR